MGGENYESTIRKNFFRALLRQGADQHENMTHSDLFTNFNADIVAFRNSISDHLGIFIQIISCCLVSLILIFVTGWLLSLVCLIILPFVIIASYLYLHFYERRNQHYKQIYSTAATLSKQAL